MAGPGVACELERLCVRWGHDGGVSEIIVRRDRATGSGAAGWDRRADQPHHGAWIDLRPGWLAGADDMFLHLLDTVPWQAERRQMYERVVDVPRLLSFYGEGEPLPHPALARGPGALDEHYRRRARRAVPHRRAVPLPRRPRQRGLARRHHRPRRAPRTPWSRSSRSASPRALAAAPARRRRRRSRFELGHGDLIVMGGSCQRTWEHAIPKTARPVGPRISVQFRPRGVR